ncbi:hypothetical protein [Streptomyces sp. NPDC058622]|uniref:hypothetical protein n=1 Tax=unclassified Streptomyces TaxID=2593676 RepID=UPI0036695B52
MATDATTEPQSVETEIRADVIVVRPSGELDVDPAPRCARHSSGLWPTLAGPPMSSWT